MSCRHDHHSSYFTNLVSAARQNTKAKSKIVKGNYLKVNVLCVPMRGSLGVEVHEAEDQLITVVYGCAVVKLGNTRCEADCVRRLMPGDSVFIPAGVWHNVCNVGNSPLKLISAYGYCGGDADCGCGCGHTATGTSNCGCSQTANDCGCNQTANTCGCVQTANVCDCGCNHEAIACASARDCDGVVFNSGEYHWTATQNQNEDCGCAINSGC